MKQAKRKQVVFRFWGFKILVSVLGFGDLAFLSV